MAKNNSRRNQSRPAKPKAPPSAPRHIAEDRALVEEHMKSQPFVLMAADAELAPIEAERRAELLSELDLVGALEMLAKLWSRFDIALLHDQEGPLQTRLLDGIDTQWARELKVRVNGGDHLLTPRALGQLVREVLESAATGSEGQPTTSANLVHLLLSIHTEQYRHPFSENALASSATLDRVSAEYGSLNLEQTIAKLRETVPEEIANLLADITLSPHVLRAETEDTWFAKWPDKVTHPDLGATPSEAFERAHEVPLTQWLVLGKIIEERARKGLVKTTRAELREAGASDIAVNRFLDEMTLSVDEYRIKLRTDRVRGSVHQQRYTLTQYPFVRIDADSVLLLRYQWAIDRFFGSHLYWSTFARLPGYKNPAPKSKSLAEAFSQGMDHVFERKVGDVLSNIASRSGMAQRIITESELQAAWTERSSSSASACDWVIKAGNVCLVVDATNHALDFFLAQGLGTVDSYAADMDRTFAAPGGKFEQLASTIEMLIARGPADFGLHPKTVFMPLIALPAGGVPNLSSTDLDLQLRSKATLGRFDGRILAPAAVPLSELQLIEGMAGKPGLPDAVRLLTQWRFACTQSPVPIRLRDFLDQALPTMNRPLPRRILSANTALLSRLEAAAVASP